MELSRSSTNVPVPASEAFDRALEVVLGSACRKGLNELTVRAQAAGDPAVATARRVERVCKGLSDRSQQMGTVPWAGGQSTPPQPVPAEQRVAQRSGESQQPARLDRSGRAVLVSGTALYGLWAGAAADVLLEVDSARAIVVPPLLGISAGLAGSLFATSEGEVTKGQAWGVITGLDYGSYLGLLLAWAVDMEGPRPLVGTMLASGLAGGLLGATTVWESRPSHGSVEMTRSGGLWGSASAALLAAILQPAGDDALSQMVLVGMGAGLATGAALSTQYPISRDRMLLADAGALAGAVATTGLFFLLAGDNVGTQRLRWYGGIALLGLHGGLATSLWLSRGWNTDPGVEETAATVPALFERNDRGQWRPGSLTLQPTLEQTGSHSTLVGGWVPVFGGNW